MNGSPQPLPRSTPDPPHVGPSTAACVAAAASAGAGLVHAAASGSHAGDTALMWLFACTAAAQLAWAAWMVLRPDRTAARVGMLLNGGAALAWALSRTVGLFGPLGGVETVGTQDLIAAVLGVVAAVAAFAAVRTPTTRAHARGLVTALASIVVLVLAVPAMAAEHSHSGAGHSHGAPEAAAHSPDHANGHDDDHEDGHADVHQHATDGAPIVSLDDPRLTRQQQRAAQGLLDSTRAALLRFPDEASITAAGYRSIGDGRGVGRYEHFVNAAFMRDGRELDPNAIESIVMQKQADGSKRVMSAMYILESGSTMADVPDIAGTLTTWHDHQNLCWDATGTRLAGVLRDGVCVPGGTFRPTAPMLHVWVDDPVCGPFTGIEGHGGASCEHAHT